MTAGRRSLPAPDRDAESPTMLRLLMMGTGEFALPAFRALYGTGHAMAALVTKPDRTGRGHHHHRNPLKEEALARGTPVLQPENVNDPEALAALRALDADLFVVAAYGQILSAETIAVPRFGAINLHASLLPRYRGAAPVQHAVWRGEAETGVTIFRIEPKLDAGSILAVDRTPIGPKETAGALEERLADLAAPLLCRTLDAIESETVEEVPQENSLATKAPRLKKSDGLIDWSQSAERVDFQVRAMQPWPKPYTFLPREGEEPLRLILPEVEPVRSTGPIPADSPAPPLRSRRTGGEPPGTVVEVGRDSIVVQAGEGSVRIVQVQPAGKRPMSVAEFLRGHAVHAGDRLGNA